MITIEMALIAFLAGCVGAVVGGTQVFIMYGIAGLFATTLMRTGMDMTFYNDVFHNTFLLPAVIFNGNVLATAFASRKYEIPGCDINRSLAFTKDPFVILMGGVGAVIGYLVFQLFVRIGIPADCGAWTVLMVEICFRQFFKKGPHANVHNFHLLMKMPMKNWLYELILAAVFSLVTGYFVIRTGLLNVPFYLSATSLLLIFVDHSFPTTHHITMVASYAAMYTHSLVFAFVFGIVSHLIFTFFMGVFNDKMETHIDPPAAGIAICSLLIFTIFG